jgi:hypothetical protein
MSFKTYFYKAVHHMTAPAAVVPRPNESNHMKDSNNNQVGILKINYDTGRAYWVQLGDLIR